jgi:hypothetical protein
MTSTPDSEQSSSPEVEHPFPLVGDVISAENHFPLGVVLPGSDAENIAAAAIITMEDGSERFGLPGTVKIEDVHMTGDHWDVDRIVAAWAKTFQPPDGEMPDDKKNDFREKLLGSMALGDDRPPTS